MSEFTNHREQRVSELITLFHAILDKKDPVTAIRQSEKLFETIIPSDIIYVVDELVRQKIPMDELKSGINKFLNVLHKAIRSHGTVVPAPGSLIEYCVKNNALLDEKLRALRPAIKQINLSPGDENLKIHTRSAFEELLTFEKYYRIKENTLFPVFEAHWPNFRCLTVMWSFHDDIRRDLRSLIMELSSDLFDVKKFNRLTGNVYFNMYAIKFREEAILFPYAAETIRQELLDSLLPECLEMGFPYHNSDPLKSSDRFEKGMAENSGKIDLLTGMPDAEQIRLIFNHLPVDITFVDENNKVRYFSTPGKRIFPRSKAIIGRDVNNCHPPESVHVVEEIIEAFRSGKESQASFWIKIKEELVLIRYFAVRDEAGQYRGVIEVSQEVSDIKALEGERRLLEWVGR